MHFEISVNCWPEVHQIHYVKYSLWINALCKFINVYYQLLYIIYVYYIFIICLLYVYSHCYYCELVSANNTISYIITISYINNIISDIIAMSYINNTISDITTISYINNTIS